MMFCCSIKMHNLSGLCNNIKNLQIIQIKIAVNDVCLLNVIDLA